MSVMAAIDIGSNAMRMVVGSISKDRQLELVEDTREPVRLGAEVFSAGRISPGTADTAALALQRFGERARELRSEFIRTVATSALREARNRQDFLDRVAAQAGLKIEVISGEEEARLIHLAVSNSINIKDKTALLIDIGGGSVELSLARRGDLVISDSLKLGTVRLLKMIEPGRPSARMFTRLVRGHVNGIKARLREELSAQGIDICVGTGGNIEALGELRCRILGARDRDRLNLEELESIIETLQKFDMDGRVRELGLKPDRADVILPAAVVLQQIMEIAELPQVRIPRVGLKDGVLLDMLPQVSENTAQFRRHQVLTYAESVGRKYRFHELHARTVTSLAASIFDQCPKLHGMDSRARMLLEVAAMLHDIGQFVNLNGHHKHSYYLIMATPFVGLTTEEKEVVANVARYHRKSLPDGQHENFTRLSKPNQEMVRKLAAILRVADALDRQHQGRVGRVEVEQVKGEFRIKAEGEGDLMLDKLSVHSKADLFQSVFKLNVIVSD